MEEENMSVDSIEEYYKYIIEQLEFVEMITVIFKDEISSMSQETSDRCRELADKIRKNVEHI